MIKINLQVITEFALIIYSLNLMKNRKIKLSLYILIPFVVDLLITNLINFYNYPNIFIVFPYCAIFYYIIKEFRVSFFEAIRMFLLMVIVVCLLQMIMHYPSKLLTYQIESKGITGICTNLTSIGILMLLNKTLKLGKEFYYGAIHEYKIGPSLLICCIALFYAIYCYRTGFYINDIICVIIICLLIAVFSILWQWQKEKFDTKEKLLKQEMLETYNTAFYDMITEMRMRQHNFNNQLNAILGLHKTTSSFEELIAKQREYCDVVLKENKYYKILGSSDNPILAGFLYQKFLEADRKDIQVAYEISLERIANKEDVYELVEMIGILMDNAMESAEQQEDDCKTIAITFITEDKGLHFSIRNRSDMIKNQEIERMFQAGYSTKGTGRGLGLPKVKETLLKRGSDICVENIIVDNETWLQFSFHYGDCIQTESSLSHRA